MTEIKFNLLASIPLTPSQIPHMKLWSKAPSPERVAGCPSDAEILSSGVCLAFLPSCPLGCSRYDDDDDDDDDDGDGDDGDDDYALPSCPPAHSDAPSGV